MRRSAFIVVLAVTAMMPSPAGADVERDPSDIELLEMNREGIPVVQLYTMGQGDVLFQKFGHAALCLRYPAQPRQDICFNYGTTDFDSPIPLTWGFVRGEANFWVSIATPRAMLGFYGALDRDIYRQDLPLTPEQALKAETRLLSDARPENRYYTYHHFYDNCTTRVRDIIDEATYGALSRDADHSVGRSFRSFGRQGFAEQKWVIVLSDLLMGRDADQDATLYEAMFLPRVLRDEVSERLKAKPTIIERRTGRQFSQDAGTGRGWILLFGVLFALPLAITQLLGRYRRVGLAVATVPLTFLGAIIWLFALVSSLAELRWNEAVFVFMPLDLALVVVGPVRRRQYARVRVAVLALVSLLLAVGVFRQPLWIPIIVAFIPMIIVARPTAIGGRGRATAVSVRH
jgi:hypothetical protein